MLSGTPMEVAPTISAGFITLTPVPTSLCFFTSADFNTRFRRLTSRIDNTHVDRPLERLPEA